MRFQAVEARSSVRDRLRDEGVDNKLGGINRFMTVADAWIVFTPDLQTAALPSQKTRTTNDDFPTPHGHGAGRGWRYLRCRRPLNRGASAGS